MGVEDEAAKDFVDVRFSAISVTALHQTSAGTRISGSFNCEVKTAPEATALVKRFKSGLKMAIYDTVQSEVLDLVQDKYEAQLRVCRDELAQVKRQLAFCTAENLRLKGNQ